MTSQSPVPNERPVQARRVAVTGAAGFIGRAVSAALRAQGAEVIGLDRAPDPAAGIFAADITRPETFRHLLEGCEAIVHTAAVVSNAVDLEEQWRVNVGGTRAVLETAAEAGVARVVHLSSVRAFSDIDFPDGVSEDHPVRTDGNPYVDTKIISEHVALSAHAGGGVDVVIIRPGDVYGPGSVPWVLKPLAVIRSGQFVLPAMGRGVFSPVYVDDLVAGLLLAISHPAAPGQIFTLSGPRSVSANEYFGYLVRFAGKRGPIGLPTWLGVGLAGAADRANRLRGQRNDVNAISMRYLARRGGYSIEKARRLLGYDPRVELDEGMRRTASWLIDHGLINAPTSTTTGKSSRKS